VGLMGGLLWSLRRLDSLYSAMTEGKPFEQAARALRITSRKLLSVYDAARKRWSPAACQRLIAFGVETDAQLRAMGQANERILLEIFLYACMETKKPVALGEPAFIY